jgi:hypothetical protein
VRGIYPHFALSPKFFLTLNQSGPGFAALYFKDSGDTQLELHPNQKEAETGQQNPSLESGTQLEARPDYVIPTSSSFGVWDMMTRIVAWKTEGYLSLWKGLVLRLYMDH